MSTYSKDQYLKIKEEHPEKIAEYSKKSYTKLKETDPERLKEYRRNAYLRYKEKNAEKLKESRAEASRKFYENNKERIIKTMMDKYYAKKSVISGTFTVSTDLNSEKVDSLSLSVLRDV